MRLEGSLDAFSLPDIFSLLSMTKKTGGLHLRRDEAHGVVWLGGGLLTGGASDLTRLSLGRRLAGSNAVTDDALSAAVGAIRADPSLGIARALRDAHAVDEADLQAIVSEHITDSVFDLMRWPDGAFEFVVDESNADAVDVSCEVEVVVAEARSRLEVWAALDPRIVEPDSVLALALDPRDEPQLDRDEWALLGLIDGRRTVGDLVDMCGRGDYTVVVALADLVDRGLVSIDESAGVDAMLRRQSLVAALEPATTSVIPSERPTRKAAAKASAPVTQVAEVAQSAAPATASTAAGATATASGVEVVAEDADGGQDAPEVVAELESADIAPSTAAGEQSVASAAPEVLSASTEPIPDATADAGAEDEAADHDEDDEDEDDEDDDEPGPSPVRELASLPRSPTLGQEIASVTPPRTETFDDDQDDSPAPLVAAMTGSGGAVAAMPSQVNGVERDPSVNKSLLLRLIAGVRGL